MDFVINLHKNIFNFNLFYLLFGITCCNLILIIFYQFFKYMTIKNYLKYHNYQTNIKTY